MVLRFAKEVPGFVESLFSGWKEDILRPLQPTPLVTSVETDGQRMAREYAEAKRVAELTSELTGPGGQRQPRIPSQTDILPIYQRTEEDASDYLDIWRPSAATPRPAPVAGTPIPSSEFVSTATAYPETAQPQISGLTTFPFQPSTQPNIPLPGTMGVQVGPDVSAAFEKRLKPFRDSERRLKEAEKTGIASRIRDAKADIAVTAALTFGGVARTRAHMTGSNVPNLPFYQHDSNESVAKALEKGARVLDTSAGAGDWKNRYATTSAYHLGAGVIDLFNGLFSEGRSKAAEAAMNTPEYRAIESEIHVQRERAGEAPYTFREEIGTQEIVDRTLSEFIAANPIDNYLKNIPDPISGKPMSFGQMHGALIEHVRSMPMGQQIVHDLSISGLIPWLGVTGMPALTKGGALARLAEGSMSKGLASTTEGRKVVEELLSKQGTDELKEMIRAGEWDVESIIMAMKDLHPSTFGTDERAVKAVRDILTENPNVSVDDAPGPYRSTAINSLELADRELFDDAVRNGQGPLIEKPHADTASEYWKSVGLQDAALITPDDIETYIDTILVDSVAVKAGAARAAEALKNKIEGFHAGTRVNLDYEDILALRAKYPSIDTTKHTNIELFNFADDIYKRAQEIYEAANTNMTALRVQARQSVADAVERGRLVGTVGRRAPMKKSGLLTVRNISGQIISAVALESLDDAEGIVAKMIERNAADGDFKGQIKSIDVRHDVNGQVMVDHNEKRMEWILETPSTPTSAAQVAPSALDAETLTRLSKLQERISALPAVMLDKAGDFRKDKARAITTLRKLIDDMDEEDIEELSTLRDDIDTYENIDKDDFDTIGDYRDERDAAFSDIADSIEDLHIPELEDLVSAADVTTAQVADPLAGLLGLPEEAAPKRGPGRPPGTGKKKVVVPKVDRPPQWYEKHGIEWVVKNDLDIVAIIDKLPDILMDTATSGGAPRRVGNMMKVLQRLPEDTAGMRPAYDRSVEYLEIIRLGANNFDNKQTLYRAALSLKFEEIKDALRDMPGVTPRTSLDRPAVPQVGVQAAPTVTTPATVDMAATPVQHPGVVNELREMGGKPIVVWHSDYVTRLEGYRRRIKNDWSEMSAADKDDIRQAVQDSFGIDMVGLNKEDSLKAIRGRIALTIDEAADSYLAYQVSGPRVERIDIPESAGGPPKEVAPSPATVIDEEYGYPVRDPEVITPEVTGTGLPGEITTYNPQRLGKRHVTNKKPPEVVKIPTKGKTRNVVRVTEDKATATRPGRLSTDNFVATRYKKSDGVGDPPGSVYGWAIRRRSVHTNMSLDGVDYIFQKRLDDPIGDVDDPIEGVFYLKEVFTRKDTARAKLIELEKLYQANKTSDILPGDVVPSFEDIYQGGDAANSIPSGNPREINEYTTATQGGGGQPNFGPEGWQPGSQGVFTRPTTEEPHWDYGGEGPPRDRPPTAEAAPGEPRRLPEGRKPTAEEIELSNKMWKQRHPDKSILSIADRLRTYKPRDWWRDVQKLFSDVYADANMTEREYGVWWMNQFKEALPADRRPGMNAALHRGSPVSAQARTNDVLKRVERALGPGMTRYGRFEGTIGVEDLNDYMDAMHMITVYRMHPARQRKSLGLTVEHFDIQLGRLGKYAKNGDLGFSGNHTVAEKRIMYSRLEAAGDIIRREYNMMLNERVVEGLVKPETALLLNKMYPYYHPLRYIESPSFQATWNPSMGSRIVGTTTNDIYHLAEIGDIEKRHNRATGELEIVPKEAEDVVGMLGKTILHHELSITLNRTARAYIRAMEQLPTLGPGLKFERKAPILNYLPADSHPSPTRMVDAATGRTVWGKTGQAWEMARRRKGDEYVWQAKRPIDEDIVPEEEAWWRQTYDVISREKDSNDIPAGQQETGVYASLQKDFFEVVVKDQLSAHEEVVTVRPRDRHWKQTGAYVTGTATRRRAQRIYTKGTKRGMANLPVSEPKHIYMQFWENGEPLIYQVPNEAGIVMAHLSRFDRSTIRRVTDFLQNPARWGITAYNPAFMAMQWVLETMNLQVVHGISPISSARALMEVALDFGGNNPEYKDMIRNRGLSLGVTGKGIAKTTEDLMKGRISIRNQKDWSNALGNASKLMTGPLSFLGHTAEVFETAPRLTAYKAYLKRYKQEAYDLAYDQAVMDELRVTTPGRGYRKEMMPSAEHLEKKADKAVFERLDSIKARAAYEARTALVDYQRWGHAVHLADSVFLYLNAGVQGALTPLRYALRQPVAATGKFYHRNPYQTRIALGLGTLMGMNEAVFLWNHNVSNEYNNYYDIPASDRIGGMVIMLPGRGEYDAKYGKYRPRYIKLWPARELALFTGPQTYMMEALLDSPHGVDWAQMLGGLSGELNMFHSVIPTESRGGKTTIPGVPVPTHVGSLAMDIINNHDSYFNREIIPPSMQDLPTQDQYTPQTSSLARRVGSAMKISPLHIDHGLNWGVYKDAFAAADWFLESLDPTTPHPIVLMRAHELNDLRNSFADQGDNLNIKGPSQNIRQAEKEFLSEVSQEINGIMYADGITRRAATIRDQIVTEADKLAKGQRKVWDSIKDRFYRNKHYGAKEQAQRTAEQRWKISHEHQSKINYKIREIMNNQFSNQWQQDAMLRNWIDMVPASHEIAITPKKWKDTQQEESKWLALQIIDLASEFPMSSYSLLADSPDRFEYAKLSGAVLNNWDDDSSRGELLYLEWRTAYHHYGDNKGNDRIDGSFDIVNEYINSKNVRPIYAAQDAYEASLSQSDRELLDHARQVNMTEMQRRWFNDKAIMKRYWGADRDVLGMMDEGSYESNTWKEYLIADEPRRDALKDMHSDVINTYSDIVATNRGMMLDGDDDLRHTLALWGYLPASDMKTEDLERFTFWNQNEPNIEQPSGEPEPRGFPTTQEFPYIPPRRELEFSIPDSAR